MVTELLPDPVRADERPTDPQAVTEAFLAAMVDADTPTSSSLLADDVLYVNVGLPPMRGRARVAKFLSALERPNFGFEVYLHAISADGPTVLTERTDVIVVGPLRLQFWVVGRFDVHDGEITMWRDAFDNFDILRSVGRGLLGALVPSLRPRPPSGPADPPGRWGPSTPLR